jgi:hypothetical protein
MNRTRLEPPRTRALWRRPEIDGLDRISRTPNERDSLPPQSHSSVISPPSMRYVPQLVGSASLAASDCSRVSIPESASPW